MKKRYEVENKISQLIHNTEFYKKYEYAIMEWYLNYREEFLIIVGGHGIGKSKTIRQYYQRRIYHTLL